MGTNLDVKEINALLEISKAIASGFYLGDVLRLIVTITAKVMDSNICSLWILDEKEQKLKLKATQSISEEYLKERSLMLGEGVVGHVALQNKPMAIMDVLKDPLYKEKELAKKEGLVSMLSVPMCVKNRVIGVINCYTSYPRVFSKVEEKMLMTIANQAAVCIENSGMMSTLDVDEILRLLLEGVIKNTGFDRARLYMLNEKKGVLECKMAAGVDLEMVKGIELPIDPEDSIVARSFVERKPYVIPDARFDRRVNPLLKEKLKLHSLVVIPIIAKEKALGVVAADHIEPGKTISKEALEAMMSFSHQAGLAIQNTSIVQELKILSQEMEDKIKKTMEDLNRAEAQLVRQAKLAALGQLAAGIAHEIRNPLTSINILFQSIKEKLPSNNACLTDLKVIEEEIGRINNIVEQFLKFARPSRPFFEKTELFQILEETLQLLRPQIEGGSISVEKEFRPIPPVAIDKEQMRQAIVNILLNAIQAMPQGGKLTLGGDFSDEDSGVKIWIKDSGVGIPREAMDKIFDPFFSTKEEGVGLGLSIAHRIVDSHHGRIEVESTLGKGTVFTIWLPLSKDE